MPAKRSPSCGYQANGRCKQDRALENHDPRCHAYTTQNGRSICRRNPALFCGFSSDTGRCKRNHALLEHEPGCQLNPPVREGSVRVCAKRTSKKRTSSKQGRKRSNRPQVPKTSPAVRKTPQPTPRPSPKQTSPIRPHLQVKDDAYREPKKPLKLQKNTVSPNTLFMTKAQIKQAMQSDFSYMDMSEYQHVINVISQSSANGVIGQLIRDGTDLPVVLKVNKDHESDNLFYEYCIGLSLNTARRYLPVFLFTYGLVKIPHANIQKFRSIGKYEIDPDDFVPIQLNRQTLARYVKTSCEKSTLGLLIQNLPVKYTFKEFISQSLGLRMDERHDHYMELTGILVVLYTCLGSMSSLFTHYDLHTSNVLLIDIGDSKVEYCIHCKDGRDITLHLRFIPIIIDYGRSHFHWMSEEVLKTVCLTPECEPQCGRDAGYYYKPNFDQDHFETYSSEQAQRRNWINLTQPNPSHDLRLLHLFKMTVARPLSEPTKTMCNNIRVKYLANYGTPASNDPAHPLDNVPKAAVFLQEQVHTYRVQDELQRIMQTRDRLMRIEMWEDMSKEAVYS